MTNEEKQTLINYCRIRIGELAPYAKQRRVMEIALAALTTQPVKLPESFYGVIQNGKVVMLPADDGQWLNKTSVAEAFRDLEQRAEAAESKLEESNIPYIRDENESFELLPGESEYDRLNRMYKWIKAKPVAAVSLAPVSRCLSFFSSVIKSGESWSPTCQRELDAARETLRNIEGAK